MKEIKRNKRIENMMAVLMLLILAVISVNMRTVNTTNRIDGEPVEIVIDPGHGGRDGGKIGEGGILEKDINLAISKKLRNYLEKCGYKVLMTRESDEGLYSESSSNKKREDMDRRCTIINESNAVMAVGIHQNSFYCPDVKGAQVFYYKNSKQGEIIADGIQKRLIKDVDPENKRKHKSNSDYYMLLNTTKPSIIVECGFLSNPTERSRLVTDEYQNKIAEAIYNGILDYIKKMRFN